MAILGGIRFRVVVRGVGRIPGDTVVYRDRLLDVLGDPPYSCKHCGFTPTADDPNEEMILHYGCKERFAIKYYVEECQNLTNSGILF